MGVPGSCGGGACAGAGPNLGGGVRPGAGRTSTASGCARAGACGRAGRVVPAATGGCGPGVLNAGGRRTPARLTAAATARRSAGVSDSTPACTSPGRDCARTSNAAGNQRASSTQARASGRDPPRASRGAQYQRPAAAPLTRSAVRHATSCDSSEKSTASSAPACSHRSPGEGRAAVRRSCANRCRAASGSLPATLSRRTISTLRSGMPPTARRSNSSAAARVPLVRSRRTARSVIEGSGSGPRPA